MNRKGIRLEAGMIGNAGGSNQASKFGTIDLKVPGGVAKLAQTCPS
jgi:hypothetical protein